jgi:hypothetical protein
MRYDVPAQRPAALAAEPVARQEPGRCEAGGSRHAERGRAATG